MTSSYTAGLSQHQTRTEEDADLRDNVLTSQNCPQEEGDYHSSASLLLRTLAEEEQQRQGKNKDGDWTRESVNN